MQLLVELSTKRRSRKKEKGKKGMKEVKGEGGKHKILCSPIRRPIKKQLN